MKRLCTIILMVALPGMLCHAQDYGLNLPEMTPPSPTAFEFIKYVTYPVDLSNGLVKISIPLYEIVDGDIRVPITLNYHASGLKPGMRSADWIGDGWSLSVGPTLTRIINGGADEQFYFYNLAAEPHPTWEQLNTVVEGANDVLLDEFSAYVGIPSADVAVCTSQGSSSARYFKYDILSQSLQEKTLLELSLPEEYVFPMPQIVSIMQKNIYIEKISFSGGYVTFTKSGNRGEGIKDITVYDESAHVVRKITFEQHYDSRHLQLILNGIRISGDGQDDEKYTFTYRPFVTDRNTRSIDEWGYYNGADNQTLVPTISTTATLSYPFMIVNVSMPGADRQPDEQAMQQGILTGITYPTGGRSEFYYEAHRYQNDSGRVMLAGGLRIKQIRDVESSGNATYRNFGYSTTPDTIDGLGIRNVIPVDSKIPGDENCKYYRETTLRHITIPFALPVCELSFKERVWTDNSMTNLFSESGSSVSYPYVTETVSSDVAGNDKIGETVSCFNVRSSYPMKFGSSQFFLSSEDEWRRGEKIQEDAFMSRGDSSDIVRTENYSHAILPVTGQNDEITKEYVYCTELPYGYDNPVIQKQYKKFAYVRHEIYNGIKILDGEHVTTYGENGNFDIRTDYRCDSVGIVKEITYDGSSPQGNKKVRLLYPQDMAVSGRDPDGVYSRMCETNMIDVPVETKEYCGDSLALTITTEYSNPTGNLFYPKQIMSVIGKDAGDARIIKFLNYDSRGNVLERENTSGQREVYLWGYGSCYPVAKIIGSDWSSVRSAADTAILNNGSEDQILSQLNALRSSFSDDPEVLIWTWLYRPLVGVTSETDPSGRSVYYEYDESGRLKRSYIKDGGEERTLKTWQYHYKL